MANPKRSKWYQAGYLEGADAARVNIDDDASRRELLKYIREDRLGEFAGEVREGQSQFAGDIVYYVDRPGGPTLEQFERWEEGWYQGFSDTAEKWYREYQHTIFNRKRS